jgi:hypothetical protein
MDIAGTETGTQENAGGMPVGPEPYNPSGQTMPTDGGPGSSATPAPGEVASPGSAEGTMVPNVSGTTLHVGPSGNEMAPPAVS